MALQGMVGDSLMLILRLVGQELSTSHGTLFLGLRVINFAMVAPRYTVVRAPRIVIQDSLLVQHIAILFGPPTRVGAQRGHRYGVLMLRALVLLEGHIPSISLPIQPISSADQVPSRGRPVAVQRGAGRLVVPRVPGTILGNRYQVVHVRSLRRLLRPIPWNVVMPRHQSLIPRR